MSDAKKPETTPEDVANTLEPQAPAYEDVYLAPNDRSAPGQYRVLRKENRRRVFGGGARIAPDFDVFEV